MNIIEIINKKRLNLTLSYDELAYAFNNYLKGDIFDYQMSALLMAICINDLTNDEIFSLVDIFIKSGEVLDLSSLKGIKVDKHSTGGIGDKITLIIGPIVAACGVIVPKMSGRGLGYTGGTIDKLESIKGFNTNLTTKEFITQLADIGFAVTSQTANLCPLDKVIYALRDVSATTESIPLIAVSIMSKKIATGADKIFIDIKCGEGALIKNQTDALKLKNIMEEIGEHYNKETICEISDMNTPLGFNIGNSLEVLEAIKVLNGKPGNLKDLALKISARMISIAKNIPFSVALKEATLVLNNGQAYKKFLDFVTYQGGDINSLKISKYKEEIYAYKTGKVVKINALNIGKLSVSLGAGRMDKTTKIDHSVGIVLNKQLNDFVTKGELLFTIYKKDNNNISINPSDFYQIN